MEDLGRHKSAVLLVRVNKKNQNWHVQVQEQRQGLLWRKMKKKKETKSEADL